MNKRTIIKISSVIAIAAALGAATGVALGGERGGDEDQGMSLLKRLLGGERAEHDGERDGGNAASTAASRTDRRHTLYAQECGACHLAYPAHALPAGSWQAIMAQLDRHFGENAELDAPDQKAISAYLTAHAGKRDWMARITSPGKVPLRITETGWFQGKHDEVPMRLVRDNPKVRSFSNCDACHTRAAEGRFGEHEVRVPSARGGWES